MSFRVHEQMKIIRENLTLIHKYTVIEEGEDWIFAKNEFTSGYFVPYCEDLSLHWETLEGKPQDSSVYFALIDQDLSVVYYRASIVQ
jgi:hypothetical protein